MPINLSQIAMSKYIAQWQEEHANFGRLLVLLEAQIALFHQGERPDYDVMLDIMYYMTQYPNRFHHPREDLAFGRLVEHDASTKAAVDDLARQHKVIMESGANLLEDLGAIVSGAVMTRETVESQAQTYITYMRNHMTKEEAELFPLAHRLLKGEDWRLIDAAIRLIDDPLFGDVVEQRFRSIHHHIGRQVGCGCAEVPVQRSS